MTNEELLTILINAVDETITKVAIESNKEIRFTIMLGIENVSSYAGNTCPKCQLQAMCDWIEKNNIGHEHEVEELIILSPGPERPQ